MKKNFVLSLMGLMLIAAFSVSPVHADDNKMADGAKAIGKGLVWGPKKLWEGTKKGFSAMGNGAKKVMGK